MIFTTNLQEFLCKKKAKSTNYLQQKLRQTLVDYKFAENIAGKFINLTTKFATKFAIRFINLHCIFTYLAYLIMRKNRDFEFFG